MPADLRERRLRLHLSQAALAKSLGVARNTVARWERNELEIRHPELIQIALDRLEQAELLDVDKLPRSRRARSGTFDQQVRTSAPEGHVGPPVRNLPREFTSFIGREQEITAVRRLLSTTPLVTLSGAGGSGKTRLASQVARTLGDRFPDGVYFIEFASLQADELVPRAVASVLEVRERPDRPLWLTLQDAVRTRQLLLVLDNCEHLLEACAGLVEALLLAGSRLRILATSREPLRVAGEMIWQLAPLSHPDRSSDASQADLERFEATRLFVERAHARYPDFVPSAADRSAIVAICQLLDGLPLAIELAAARIVVLSCAQLAARLDEALPLLTTGVRTAPARQQTLRATVDWSHALLTPAEQVVFRRLAAFAGGWNLEAAESLVCDDGRATYGSSVLDLLQRLVDKSLVVREVGAGEARFRFLETIRQYAAERLAEAGEDNLVRGRHLAWCKAMVVDLCGDGTSVVMADAFVRLEQEHDNIRSALRWSIDAAEIETGLNLGAALYQFWYMHSHYSEGIAWLTELLGHPKGRRPRPQRLSAMLGRGLLATLHGRYAEAQEWLAESLALADELGDLDQKSSALHHLGKVANYRGEPALARTYHEQSVQIKRELGNKLGQVIAQVELSKLILVSGDATGAVVLGQETLTMARAGKFAWGEAGALLVLGRAAHVQGKLRQAQALLDRSLTHCIDYLGTRKGWASP
jgi:non-specific serine/threonine protein kinase